MRVSLWRVGVWRGAEGVMARGRKGGYSGSCGSRGEGNVRLSCHPKKPVARTRMDSQLLVYTGGHLKSLNSGAGVLIFIFLFVLTVSRVMMERCL